MYKAQYLDEDVRLIHHAAFGMEELLYCTGEDKGEGFMPLVSKMDTPPLSAHRLLKEAHRIPRAGIEQEYS